MKILRDSGYDHWIHAKEITCTMCDTIFQTETSNDFWTCATDNVVGVSCPKCGQEQEVNRYLPIKLDPLPWNPVPVSVPWNPYPQYPKITWNKSTVTTALQADDDYEWPLQTT